MIWLIFISLLIIVAYTVAVCVKQKGIPASISATFYKLEHPYWFMATMWLTACLLMPAILEISSPNTEYLSFLGLLGMFLVGVAPNFKDKFEGKIHTTGAVMCIAGSQLWVAFNNPWCLFPWIIYVIYTIIMMIRHHTDSIVLDFLHTKPMFWVEIIAFLNLYICLTLLIF